MRVDNDFLGVNGDSLRGKVDPSGRRVGSPRVNWRAREELDTYADDSYIFGNNGRG